MHELNDILAHRDGWDPRRHPAMQEVLLHQAVRDRCLTAYRQAAEHERQAWRTAEVAAAALQSLRDEAYAAKLRAGDGERTPGQLWWAEQWAPEEPPRFDEEPGVDHPVPFDEAAEFGPADLGPADLGPADLGPAADPALPAAPDHAPGIEPSASQPERERVLESSDTIVIPQLVAH